MSQMDGKLWGHLSPELVERVMAFLPLPSLTRFRTVSKRMNIWIFSPEFLKLCDEIRELPKTRVFLCSNAIVGTVNVSASARAIALDSEVYQPFLNPTWKPRLRAAAGSILFVECSIPDDISHQQQNRPREACEVVIDLEANTCRRLPLPTMSLSRGLYKKAILGVDENAKVYKVVIVEQALRARIRHEPWTLDIYDSSSMKWKVLLGPRSRLVTSSRLCYQGCLIFNRVYILLRKDESNTEVSHHFLVCFNNQTEKYEQSFIQVPKCLLGPKVMVCGNRLLLIGWAGCKSSCLQIWEVDVSTNEFSMVAQLPNSFMEKMLVTKFCIADGCNYDFIFIILNFRLPVIYDLCRGTWRQLQIYPNPGGNASAMFELFVDVNVGDRHPDDVPGFGGCGEA